MDPENDPMEEEYLVAGKHSPEKLNLRSCNKYPIREDHGTEF
jgi:hypothetical protein